MANSDTVEYFVSSTFKPSFVTINSNFSGLVDISESGNVCSFNHTVRLNILSTSIYMTYVFIAAFIAYLSVVLNAVVIAYYRKPQTCSRMFVFALVFKDYASVTFNVLQLIFPRSVFFTTHGSVRALF